MSDEKRSGPPRRRITNQEYQQQDQLLARLRVKFPDAFPTPSPPGEAPVYWRALKIGIHLDLEERLTERDFEGILDDPSDVDARRATIRNMLRIYCNRDSYHGAVKKSEWRVDLDGNPTERIEDKHRQQATKIRDNRKALRAQRRARKETTRQKARHPESGQNGTGDARSPENDSAYNQTVRPAPQQESASRTTPKSAGFGSTLKLRAASSA